MKISNDMSVAALAEAMGDIATEQDAQAMRALLVQRHDGMDTADVPDDEWHALLSMAVR